MDSPIRGPVRAGAYAPHYLPRPSREKGGTEDKTFSLEEAESDVVLEPQPRRSHRELAVSHDRLEDEAGQIIDLRG